MNPGYCFDMIFKEFPVSGSRFRNPAGDFIIHMDLLQNGNGHFKRPFAVSNADEGLLSLPYTGDEMLEFKLERFAFRKDRVLYYFYEAVILPHAPVDGDILGFVIDGHIPFGLHNLKLAETAFRNAAHQNMSHGTVFKGYLGRGNILMV